MTQTIVRVPAVQAARIFAVIYLVLGVVAVPFFLLPLLVTDSPQQPLGMAFVVLLPVFYGVAGFVGTLLMCALYNAVAKRVGGLQIELAGPV